MNFNPIGLYIVDTIIIIILIIGCCYHKHKYKYYIENNDENIDKLKNFIKNNDQEYLQNYNNNEFL